MSFVPLIAAESSRISESYPSIIRGVLLLVAVIVIGLALAAILRRMFAAERTSGGGQGFALQELRDLHGQGELTDEEFARAKAAMIKGIVETKSEKSGVDSHESAE